MGFERIGVTSYLKIWAKGYCELGQRGTLGVERIVKN